MHNDGAKIYGSGFSQCIALIHCSSALLLLHQSLFFMYCQITSWLFCQFKNFEWPVDTCLFCSMDPLFRRTHCRYDCDAVHNGFRFTHKGSCLITYDIGSLVIWPFYCFFEFHFWHDRQILSVIFC